MVCLTLYKKAPLVGAFFIACAMASFAHSACPLPQKTSEARVQYVIDGDTVRLVDGRRIRLIGLDTPELARKGLPDEPFAQAARVRLAELVAANGDRVRLQYGTERRDRYGRTLAHLYDDQGRNLEEILLREGYARMIAIAPNVALADCHLSAELDARREGLRLWTVERPISATSIQRAGFALVQGRVQRVERNEGGVWLELDGPLVLRVAPRDIERFGLRALTEQVDQRVEARGWIVDRRKDGRRGQARWMLTLTDPATLRRIP